MYFEGKSPANPKRPPWKIPLQMLNPDFVEEFSGNPTHSFRLLLQQNDISQWAPQAPIRLIHCSGDFTIPFENSQLVFNHIKKMGIDQVEEVGSIVRQAVNNRSLRVDEPISKEEKTSIEYKKNIKLENICRPWKKFQNLINIGSLIRV